jgi:hypothetical protein
VGSSRPELPTQYPEELIRNGREVDPVFLPDELLYYRIVRLEGNRVNPIDIPFTDDIAGGKIKCALSVNRGKYSQPHHVLYSKYPKHINDGVVKFSVRDIPEAIEHVEEHTILNFRVEHDPLEDNYSHSQIRAFRDGVRVKPISEWFRKKLRTILSERMIPVIPPAEGPPKGTGRP